MTLTNNNNDIIKQQEDDKESLLENNINNQFEEMLNVLQSFKTQITGLQNIIKGLEKNVRKQSKTLEKINIKNKNKGNRKPSGFAKPTKVTNELCEFMKKKEGTEIARTEVTRALCSYIKEHKLENTNNSKIIAPDDKLKNLLGIEEGQELTYFTIQKYMNKHFI
jgi:chromatin remodeling complex protein RSC6